MYFKCSNVPFRCLHAPGWQGQCSPSRSALPQPWKVPAAPVWHSWARRDGGRHLLRQQILWPPGQPGGFRAGSFLTLASRLWH